MSWRVLMAEKVYNDKHLVDFLSFLADYVPAFPDELVDYYATSSGFQTSDVGTKRLLAVATQKFVADVASDAMQFYRMRQGAAGAKRKMTLTHDDLVSALKEYGVRVNKPEYFADSRNASAPSSSTGPSLPPPAPAPAE